MILLVSTTIDVTWAVWRANRPFTFKVPRPNTKTTQKGMCLKPQVVPVRVRTRQWNCTFQCKANMMASDRDTWVCKCLQLIYLSALHLTLFNIYITINKTNSFNQMSLSWGYDYLPGAWISVDPMICKRASPVMEFGFGSFWGQTGWPCSKNESQRQNCWEAVEIGQRESFSCPPDTAFTHYSLSADLSSGTM